MIEKLRKNFALSNFLSKVFYVVCASFGNWFTCVSVVGMIYTASVWLVLLVDVFTSVVLVLLIPLLIRLLLNMLRLYTIPLTEYTLLAIVFLGFYHLLVGILQIPYFFTPILAVWGLYLLDFVASTVCLFAFYKVTAKLYFNAVTEVYYFKVLVIFYFVFNVLTCVSALLGGVL